MDKKHIAFPHLLFRMALFLPYLSCLSQTSVDTVFVYRNNTKVYGRFLGDQPIGNCVVMETTGNYKTGTIITEIKNTKITKDRRYAWGYQIGKWSYFSKDSILKAISETTFSDNGKTYAVKGYTVKDNDTLFNYYNINRQTLWGIKEITCNEDGIVTSYTKKNGYRYVSKTFWYNTETKHYHLKSKLTSSKVRRRTKTYSYDSELTQKTKYKPWSRDQIVKTYDPTQSRVKGAKKQVIKYQPPCRWYGGLPPLSNKRLTKSQSEK